MTTQIVPWTEKALDDREAVFTGLIENAVKGIVKKINAQLRAAPLTAATAPVEAPAGVLEAAEATTLENWQIFVETTAFPFVVDTFTDSAGLVVEAMQSATGLVIEPVTNEFAVEFLSYASNRMVKVGLGVWHGIRAELVEGFSAGESIDQISARLTQFPEVSASRAHTVARTEVISAANGGSYAQMLEYDLGADVKKEWLATEDTRTRLSHKHADNQSVELTGQFTVDIYDDVVKVGTEEMEFPGDHTATPGNVINCRCTLGFTFDEDEILTASGDFIEAQHPRDHDGKFTDKPGGSFLPDLSKLTDNQFISFVKGLTQKTWDGYSKQQQDKIAAHHLSSPSPANKEKLVKLIVGEGPTGKKARPQGGVDNATGKPTKPGKPVMLKNKALFYTTYDNGAVVAVKKDSGERIIWNGDTKKMERQQRDADGNWKVSESLTRGALKQKYQDEEGWTTPTGNDFSPTAAVAPVSSPTPAVNAGKPVKLRVNILYNTKYDAGQVIAVRPESDERLIWNGKKAERQSKLLGGNWSTFETLSMHQVYVKYKDEDGWFKPGSGETAPVPAVAPIPSVQAPEIVAPEPSQNVLPGPIVVVPMTEIPEPALAPKAKKNEKTPATLDPETGKFTKPVTLTATWDGQTETRTTQNPYKFAAVVDYGNGKGVIASWHRTAAAASKGVITGMQKKNGVKVIAVIPVEWPEGLAGAPGLPASKYNLPNIQQEMSDASVPAGTILFQNGPLELRKTYYVDQLHLRYTHADGSVTNRLLKNSKELTDEKINDAVAEVVSEKASLAAEPVKALADNSSLPKAKLKFTADMLTGKTSTSYTHGQIIAESSQGPEARIIWNGNIKKFQTQIKDPQSNKWLTAASFNKQAAYKKFKDATGWYEPKNKQDVSGGNTPGDAPTPSVWGNPVPVTHISAGQPGTKDLTSGDLQKQASAKALTPLASESIYKKFRFALGPGKQTLTTSPPSDIFLSAVIAQLEHNEKNPTHQVSLLQTLQAIDERGAAAAGYNIVNKKLYETAVTTWLHSPEGKSLATQLIADAKNIKVKQAADALAAAKEADAKAAAFAKESAAKAAIAKANASLEYKTFTKIPVSKPAPKPGDTHEAISDDAAQKLQAKMVPAGPGNVAGINGLSTAQKDAIQDYKYSSYQLNEYLRSFGVKSNTLQVRKHAALIQKSMRPVPEPILLYRGVGSLFDSNYKPTAEQLNALAGKRMTEHGFSSTSIDPTVFSNTYRLQIQVPAGTPAMYVQHLGVKSHDSEKEWILAAGLHFEIIDAKNVGSKIIVNVKVVP